MALTEFEKSLIRDVINIQMSDLSVDELKKQVKVFNDIVGNPENENEDPLKVIFDDPQKMIHPTEARHPRPVTLARPTNGEVREYMLDCVDEAITETCKSEKFNKDEIEWNCNELRGLIKAMPDNGAAVEQEEQSSNINLEGISFLEMMMLAMLDARRARIAERATLLGASGMFPENRPMNAGVRLGSQNEGRRQRTSEGMSREDIVVVAEDLGLMMMFSIPRNAALREEQLIEDSSEDNIIENELGQEASVTGRYRYGADPSLNEDSFSQITSNRTAADLLGRTENRSQNVFRRGQFSEGLQENSGRNTIENQLGQEASVTGRYRYGAGPSLNEDLFSQITSNRTAADLLGRTENRYQNEIRSGQFSEGLQENSEDNTIENQLDHMASSESEELWPYDEAPVRNQNSPALRSHEIEDARHYASYINGNQSASGEVARSRRTRLRTQNSHALRSSEIGDARRFTSYINGNQSVFGEERSRQNPLRNQTGVVTPREIVNSSGIGEESLTSLLQSSPNPQNAERGNNESAGRRLDEDLLSQLTSHRTAADLLGSTENGSQNDEEVPFDELFQDEIPLLPESRSEEAQQRRGNRLSRLMNRLPLGGNRNESQRRDSIINTTLNPRGGNIFSRIFRRGGSTDNNPEQFVPNSEQIQRHASLIFQNQAARLRERQGFGVENQSRETQVIRRRRTTSSQRGQRFTI